MKITEISNQYGILFDNGKILDVVHWSDCCEDHWADLSVLESYNISTTTGKETDIYTPDFSGTPDMIQPIEDLGFNLVATNGDKFFVPCYGENNGYYSTNLTLQFGEWYGEPEEQKDGRILYQNTWHSDFEIDLSECQDISWTY